MFFELAAHADEVNQKTTITFSAPVQIPGQVLPAGNYVFTVDPEGQNLVRIANTEGNVYASLQTASTQDINPADETTVVLAEQGASQPPVLLKWIYPGNTVGHEFIYPRQQEQGLARATATTIVANPPTIAAEYAGSN
jgi:Protein of unknown function (DUF2911)